MNLAKKKALAVKTLGVGKARIIFNNTRLDEIKEAITKQDIRDLVNSGAIIIVEIHGRKTVQPRTGRRRQGSVKKRVINTKRVYMARTRKLRAYLVELRKQGKITPKEYIKLRKGIKASTYRNKMHMKEHMPTQ